MIKKPVKLRKKEKLLRSTYLRICIVISFLIIVSALIIFVFISSYNMLFDNNPRFVLKDINIESPGYWNNKKDKMEKILGLKRGKTNLFQINLLDLRNKLKNQREYSIENIEIEKVLPDTINFKIIERIPRAKLYNKNSNLIVDGNGILINKQYCININNDLPVITGFSLKKSGISNKNSKNKQIPFGEKLPQIIPALMLISLVNLDFPNLNIKLINLYNPKSISVFMKGPKGKKTIEVILPFEHSDTEMLNKEYLKQTEQQLRIKFKKLEELFRYFNLRGQSCSQINLMFKDQAVVK